MVSTYRHLGTHGAVRSCKGGGPCKKILSQRCLSKKVRAAVARAVIGSVALRRGPMALPPAPRTLTPWRTRTWRLSGPLPKRWLSGHILASSQEICRRLGILDFKEAVSVQRLRLAARLVNAAPSLMALLQSVAGRARKDDLARDSALLRQEMGPQLADVKGLRDLVRLLFEHPKAWKQLVPTCQRKLVERRSRSGPSQPFPIPVLPTLGCDQCDAVYGKLRALRSHHMRAQSAYRMEVRARRCAQAWSYGGLEPFQEDAMTAAGLRVRVAQRWWRMSTSLPARESRRIARVRMFLRRFFLTVDCSYAFRDGRFLKDTLLIVSLARCRCVFRAVESKRKPWFTNADCRTGKSQVNILRAKVIVRYWCFEVPTKRLAPALPAWLVVVVVVLETAFRCMCLSTPTEHQLAQQRLRAGTQLREEESEKWRKTPKKGPS